METNIEKIKNQLSGLAAKTTGEDKRHAAVDLNCSVVTIERYLRGLVRKEAFGLILLGYLKNKISEREKALA